MSHKDAETGHALLVATLSQARTHRFDILPDTAQRGQLAEELGLNALRKLRFAGEIRSAGKRDWLLTGTLGATVVQPCVQTLAPVTTRIDTEVSRRFVPETGLSFEPGSETEMPEDESIEHLGSHIDPWAVMVEALALAVPDYPRADDAPALGEYVVTEPGKTPLREDDTKPFAGLASLRDKLGGGPDHGEES